MTDIFNFCAACLFLAGFVAITMTLWGINNRMQRLLELTVMMIAECQAVRGEVYALRCELGQRQQPPPPPTP